MVMVILPVNRVSMKKDSLLMIERPIPYEITKIGLGEPKADVHTSMANSSNSPGIRLYIVAIVCFFKSGPLGWVSCTSSSMSKTAKR